MRRPATRRLRAIAAAWRTGAYSERTEFDPPVSWLNWNSGRALDKVTCTRWIGMSISSAISIAIVVVMPWPTSARGTAKDTVPSL
jgi:hypothetical protein